MNWKFWNRPKRETLSERVKRESDEYFAEQMALREEALARKKAERDALPDHRKAARIEYAFFQAMARKPAPTISIAMQEHALHALHNNALRQQYGPFYGQHGPIEINGCLAGYRP